ncbi:MAG: DUF202 domain-containing protein [Luteibacter sp.]|uniref:YidH family protein n=1 Tax=Luteibacter sp. TaxID=1886636 RepID=UPI002807C0D3|nr:DUF202 domain-containing protein [Luteibacter sp.]MDQ7995255.1 DUF202 domain-containing protein [Luteibacter sp.]
MIPHFTDHAANERTYLAWVRTAIAVMAFGFLLERFNLFLAYAVASSGRAAPALHTRASEWLGLALIALGAAITLLATVRYQRNRRRIDATEAHPYAGSGFQRLLSALLVLMALFLVTYVARQLIALS